MVKKGTKSSEKGTKSSKFELLRQYYPRLRFYFCLLTESSSEIHEAIYSPNQTNLCNYAAFVCTITKVKRR